MTPDASPVYRFDPDRRPDSEFQQGALSLLVSGNEGRLLDARRTPMRIVGVSATLSIDVAGEHFRGGPSTRTAAILRQPLPHRRLLMTFLETPAMNAPFKEAEAVLVGPVGEALF